MKDSEIYQGFTKQETTDIKQEVAERWGESQLKKTEERIRKMGREGWKDTKEKGEKINQLLADMMDLSPEDNNTQNAIELHFRHMNLFYEISKEKYLALGKMYIEDERFKNSFEKYRTGLADFLNKAIQIFCDSNDNSK